MPYVQLSRANFRRRAVALGALTSVLAAVSETHADDWYAEVHAGFNSLGSTSVLVSGSDAQDGLGDLDTDNGWGFGGAVGRGLGENWRIEGEIAYRTNDYSALSLPGGGEVTDGDYSSLALAASVYYDFGADSATWRPYLGAGLTWLQEVDIDLQNGPVENSFSGDGFGWQVMAGVAWQFSERWVLDLEARYLDAGRIAMDAEQPEPAGRIEADYSLFGVSAALRYRF